MTPQDILARYHYIKRVKELRGLKIYCWRYLRNTRNYPGLHLSTDLKGCHKLISAIECIRNNVGLAYIVHLRQKKTDYEYNISGGGLPCKWLKKIIIIHTYAQEKELYQMCIMRKGDIATLLFEQLGMEQFEHGIFEMSKGRGDYNIGSVRTNKFGRRMCMGKLDKESVGIWFWPWRWFDPSKIEQCRQAKAIIDSHNRLIKMM